MSGGNDEYKESMESIGDIFTDIAGVVEAQAKLRCPYRNRHDRCTALFVCGHQEPAPDEKPQKAHDEEPRKARGETPPKPACTHLGGNDYAMQWTQDPLDGAT
jgi:hypothetical protein